MTSVNSLAHLNFIEGKYEQAEALLNQTLEIQRRVLGPESRDTLWTMNKMANIYEEEGEPAQARGALQRSSGDAAASVGPPTSRYAGVNAITSWLLPVCI